MTESADRPLTIGMVAGEASGDNLGAALTRQINLLVPGSHVFGIGGPAMQAEGFESLYDMEILSVNGFVDPILRLRSLFKLLFGIKRCHHRCEKRIVSWASTPNFFKSAIGRDASRSWC